MSVGLATLIGVPLGILPDATPGMAALGARRRERRADDSEPRALRPPDPGAAASAASGTRTALVALTLYALLPVLRNTVVGITGVDPAVREAGRGSA